MALSELQNLLQVHFYSRPLTLTGSYYTPIIQPMGICLPNDSSRNTPLLSTSGTKSDLSASKYSSHEIKLIVSTFMLCQRISCPVVSVIPLITTAHGKICFIAVFDVCETFNFHKCVTFQSNMNKSMRFFMFIFG